MCEHELAFICAQRLSYFFFNKRDFGLNTYSFVYPWFMAPSGLTYVLPPSLTSTYDNLVWFDISRERKRERESAKYYPKEPNARKLSKKIDLYVHVDSPRQECFFFLKTILIVATLGM